MNRSATADGGSSVSYRPAGSSTRRCDHAIFCPTSAARSGTETSVKSRVPVPAHTERPKSGLLPLSSTRPVGWSWRSRRPVEVPRYVVAMECSAKPNSSSSRSRAAPNASPSAGANSRKTSMEVSAGSTVQSPAPAGASLISGTASSAGPASRAACSLAATSSSMSGVPVRATVPAAIPAPPSTKETTTTRRERIDPLVVRLLPAQRRLASELSTTKATCPSAVEAASAFSTTSCGVRRLTRPPRWRSSDAIAWLLCSWMSSRARSSPTLLHGVEDVHLVEPGRRTAVAHRRDLAGLALPAVEGPAEDVGLRAADHRHGAPEVGRRRLVGDVAQLPGEPAALDPVEPLAGELEVVALHVDRPALVADDEDAAIDPGDDLLGGGAARCRLQGHVGHPLHRHVAGGVGEGAAVGPGHAAQPRHVPVDLVADQDAVLDEVPLLAGDALVVPAHRRQAVRGGAVAGDVHQRGAVLQRAQLVDGREARPRVRGLVAQRPVQLGGVPDRLVDGQEEVGRVDDQVVAAGLDRRGLRLLAQQVGDPGELAAPVPAGAGEVLPAATDRRREGPHALEGAGGPVDGEGGELRVDAHPLLAGAGGRGGGGGILFLSVPAPGTPRRPA